MVRVALLLIGAQGAGDLSGQDPEGLELFEKRIRPVLVERCYECHSAQALKLRGRLRLDTREGLLQGGASGPAIVPGDPGASLLLKAIRQEGTDLRMPLPPRARLGAQEVADFAEWVRRGAPIPPAASGPASGEKDQEWEARRKWVFAKPLDPPVPEVRAREWVRNPIDAFILSRLEGKGLRPAPPAERHVLIRRAFHDLLGLPPPPEELELFLEDPAPEAYSRLIDRLLADPRYGERWGRHWLDLVRYTSEFEEAWRYRDWVVRAFNADLPYDRFIVHQIAGDLLPSDQPGGVNADGITATGVLAIGPWGGLDKKKMLTDIADDEIDLVGRTFLGLTLACARCHDHKFDPITVKDYYGLAGIFLSSHVLSGMSYAAHGSQRMRFSLLSGKETEDRERSRVPLREAEARLAGALNERSAALARSLLPRAGRYLAAAERRSPPAGQAKPSREEIAAREGLLEPVLKRWEEYLSLPPMAPLPLLSTRVAEFDNTPRTRAFKVMLARSPWLAVNTTESEIHIDSFVAPGRAVFASPGASVAWRSPIRGTVRVQGRLSDQDAGGGGIDWIVDHSRGGDWSELARGKVPNEGALRLAEADPAGRLSKLEVEPGDMIHLHLFSGQAHYDTVHIELTIAALDGSGEWDLAREVVDDLLQGNPHPDSRGNPAVWHFFDLTGSRRQERLLAVDRWLEEWRGAVSEAAAGKRDRGAVEDEARKLEAAIAAAGPASALVRELTGRGSPFWLSLDKVEEKERASYLSAEEQRSLGELRAEVERLRKTAPPSVPYAYGIQEGGVPYSLYPGLQDVPVHVRGSYSSLGEVVPRCFPRALAGEDQPPIREGSGRRELAGWLSSPGNPLTARVLVNRIWQHHFGEGLVRTPSNFGKLGEAPTHPELLDWLAHRFTESGWSIKAMHRLIMLSAAYQQSCRAPPESAEKDPDNRLFGRAARRRLQAEEVRDSLLAMSGELDARAGGPEERDGSRLRRTLYLSTVRGSRSTFAVAFDAADPAGLVARRSSSTVAPQALYLMNDPWVLERVRRLAARSGAEPCLERRIDDLHRLVDCRRATPEEQALGRAFLEALPPEPPAGTSLSAWELYAQALVLANEFMFVD